MGKRTGLETLKRSSSSLVEHIPEIDGGRSYKKIKHNSYSYYLFQKCHLIKDNNLGLSSLHLILRAFHIPILKYLLSAQSCFNVAITIGKFSAKSQLGAITSAILFGSCAMPTTRSKTWAKGKQKQEGATS